MLRLILLILLVPIGFIVVRLGWPGLIAVVTVAVAVYAFLLLKDAPSRIKIAFLLSAFVLQALLIAWGILWTLQQVDVVLAADRGMGPLFQLVAGPDSLQSFWAVVGGFTLAALLFGLLLGSVSLLTKRPSDQQTSPSRNKSYSRTIHRALGTVPARWVARDGQIITTKAPKPPRSPLTGPGEVEVQRGHAVILEQQGIVTDVLPAGVHWINDQERIAMLVPLYGRADRVVVRNAATSDGLQLSDLEIMVFHKVYSDDATPQIGDEKFKFNKDILQDRVWSASGNTWEAGVRGVTEREARSVIAGYQMEELVTMNQDQRDKFKANLQEKINAVTREFMGVVVTVTGFGTINAPDLAAEKLMARWTAEKERAIAWDQAVQQNRIMVDTATARRDAFNMLFDAMNSALEKHPEARDLVTMSFVERMERIDGDAPSNPNQDMEALGKLYVIEALKNLTGRQNPHEGTTAT